MTNAFVFPGQGSFGPATQAIVDGAMGDALRMVIERGDPFLGICLGAQMLARHLGATVRPHPEGHVEVGYYPIYPTEASRAALPWPGSPPAPAIVVGGIAEPPVPAAEPAPDDAPPPPPPTTSAAATPPPTSASPASANIKPLFDRGACCCGSTCPAADAIDGDGGGYPP